MDAGLLVAREGELEAIRALLRGDGAHARALVLEGDPGVGKTSLWERGVAWAREDGRRVLVARASEAEGGLPFAGLIDLFDAVTSEELGSVPAPQVRALDVALYRADPTDRPPEAQVISLAVLSALRALSEGERILVAIDDLQWLDSASEEAIAYAARRLHAEPVTFLLARRPGRRTAVEKAFPDEQLVRVDVGAISLGATRQILAARLGLRLPHHLLRRVYETTMGNPLFAIEVGRMLAGRDLDTLGDDLPVPDDVEDLLGLRVADLDEPARRALLALALHPDLRVGQLGDLAGPAALDDAVAAGVVTVDGERVRAAHPLLAAAVKRQAAEDDQRQLHRGLAEVVADEQRRALHLALATTVPDEDLAADLDLAAARAAARGATRLAIDLAAHAWRLTPPERPDVDRVLALGRHLHDAGEKQRLTELLAARVESAAGRRCAGAGVHAADRRGGAGQRRHPRVCSRRRWPRPATTPRCVRRCCRTWPRTRRSSRCGTIARADDRATEAVALSELGSADDQRARCPLPHVDPGPPGAAGRRTWSSATTP